MAERPEDLNLPNAVVSRIIKEALPPSVKVSKEAQAAVAKAASVFVLYATSCANNVAIKGHRKTINGNDVIKAMEDMEFNKFIDPLENSLESKYNNHLIFRAMTHRGEILYSRGRISSCKTVYIEFLWCTIVSVLME